jgi:phage terminase small subunit
MAYLKQGSEVPAKGKGSKISPKMARFVDEYMIDMNASAAVLRVPYKTTNPNRVGAELLRHPLVVDEIKRRTEKKRENMELKADYLINKLIAIIEDGEVKTADTLRAIELAGKSIALWKERQEITGADGEAIRVQEQKIEREVDDFKSRIASIAERGGASVVPIKPKPRGAGES